MKLGLFIPTKHRTPETVLSCIWIRVFQLLKPWQSFGVDVSLNHFFKYYDCAIVYRSVEISTIFKILWLRLFAKKIYYDQVINFFEFGPHVIKKREIFIRIISKLVDGIICTTPPIELSAKKFNPNVFRIPEGIDPHHFSKVKRSINFSSPTFIWSGVPHKAIYLNRFASIISNKIILITSPAISKESLEFNYQFLEWTHALFPEHILNGDIALLPRDISSIYNQAHSEFKALVFAVSGLPIIANKQPSYIQLNTVYDGIVFLEDYHSDINQCIEALKTKSLDTTTVRKEYDVYNLCKQHLKIFQRP